MARTKAWKKAAVGLCAVASVAVFGALAQADITTPDGDGATPVSTALNPVEFGTVCTNQDTSKTVLIAIERKAGKNGITDPQSVFGNGATVTVSGSESSADVSQSMNDNTIVLPSDWLTTSEGTMSTDTAEMNVTVNPSTVGAGTATIATSAQGTNANNSGTITRTTASAPKVNWTAEECLSYDFTGFFRPVDNIPTLNTVKAGQSIPVKFSLNGDQGLDIFADNSPRSFVIDCDTQADLDSIENTVTAGGSSLSYDPVADQYVYVWKTNKLWANSCRQLDVELMDGSTHSAWFKFTK